MGLPPPGYPIPHGGPPEATPRKAPREPVAGTDTREPRPGPDAAGHWEPYRGISKPGRPPRPRWPYICTDAETAAHARRDGNRLSVYARVFLPACLAPLSAPRPASTASLSLRLAPARRSCRASSWPAAGRLDPALERLPCACRAVQADLRTPVMAARGGRQDIRQSSPRRQPVRCRSGYVRRPTHPLAMNAVTLGVR